MAREPIPTWCYALVVVRNCVDDESWSYRARCSKCDTTFVGGTPAALARPAVAAGLAIELWTLPKPSARRFLATIFPHRNISSSPALTVPQTLSTGPSIGLLP